MIEKPCIALETGDLAGWKKARRDAPRLVSGRARASNMPEERTRAVKARKIFSSWAKKISAAKWEKWANEPLLFHLSCDDSAHSFACRKFPPGNAYRAYTRAKHKRTGVRKEKYRGVSATRLNKSCLARTNGKQSADRTAGRPACHRPNYARQKTQDRGETRRDRIFSSASACPPVQRKKTKVAHEPKTNASN